MSLGGIIAGALSGGSKGVSEVGAFGMEKEAKIDYARQLTEMQAEKEKMLEQFRSDIRNSDADKDVDRRIKSAIPIAVATGKADVAGQSARLQARRDQGLTDLEAADALARHNAGRALVQQQNREKVEDEMAALRRQVSDPNFLADTSKAALAKDPVGSKNADSNRINANANASRAATDAENARAAREERGQTRTDQTAVRQANADYLNAVNAGDEAAAMAARMKAVLSGGADPAASSKGALKVTEDDMGRKVLVHEDSRGRVTRVDTADLTPYRPTGASASTPQQANPTGPWASRAAPSASAPSAAPPAAAKPEPKAAVDNAPTYQGWLATKRKIDEVKSKADKMSPEARESYLANRLPELEWELERQSKYAKY